MVVLGHDDTTAVTMDHMVSHCAAAARGAKRSLLVGDLPFGSCLTPEEAARNGTPLSLARSRRRRRRRRRSVVIVVVFVVVAVAAAVVVVVVSAVLLVVIDTTPP